MNRIQEVLNELQIEAWIMYCDEKSDPIFTKYITDKTVVRSCAIVTPKETYLLVNVLDIDNINEEKYKVLSFTTMQDLQEKLAYVLTECLDYPERLHFNYSTANDTLTDTIGHGIYTFLTNVIATIYQGRSVKYLSAEEIIYTLFERKSNKTVSRMKKSADIALEILEESFSKLKRGQSEKDIVKITQEIFEEKKKKVIANEIIDMKYSWEKELCPIVLTGPSLEKGGHALASEQILERGYTIYYDFGVTLIYKDQERVSSDIQRMGYLLKENETKAPIEVQRVFDTLISAIDKGIAFIRPEVKGYEVDAIVRNIILENDYPNYNHSTGHPIGENAHNPGTMLAPKSVSSNRKIQKGGTYTIEPRIAIPNGGSIEEMVYVTETEGIPISKRQKEIYLIK